VTDRNPSQGYVKRRSADRQAAYAEMAKAAAEPRNWGVYDRYAPLDRQFEMVDPGPEFGPMTEAEARQMAARNPDGYYAARILPKGL
jgi:hypothetical protein